MKKLFLVLVLLLMATPVWAEPFLVCDPQTDADGYIYTLNGGPEVQVPYQTQTFSDGVKAVIADAASIPEGPFTYQVKAYKDDPVWGRLQSTIVPFSSTRPGIGTPSNVGMKR